MRRKILALWIAVVAVFGLAGCVHFDFQRVRDWGGDTVSELRSEGIRSPKQIEEWIYRQENGFDIHKGTLALLWIATRQSGEVKHQAVDSYFNVFMKTHEGWPREAIIPASGSYREQPDSREQFFEYFRSDMVSDVVTEKARLRRKVIPRDVSHLEDLLSKMKDLGGFHERALRPLGVTE